MSPTIEELRGGCRLGFSRRDVSTIKQEVYMSLQGWEDDLSAHLLKYLKDASTKIQSAKSTDLARTSISSDRFLFQKVTRNDNQGPIFKLVEWEVVPDLDPSEKGGFFDCFRKPTYYLVGKYIVPIDDLTRDELDAIICASDISMESCKETGVAPITVFLKGKQGTPLFNQMVPLFQLQEQMKRENI